MFFRPLIALAFLITTPSWCIEDSEANRVIAAERYMDVVPLSEHLDVMVLQMVQGESVEKQNKIKSMIEFIDHNALSRIMKSGMIKVYTVDELNALADFYSTPGGKSAMKKAGLFTSTIFPQVQVEIQKAFKLASSASRKNK